MPKVKFSRKVKDCTFKKYISTEFDARLTHFTIKFRFHLLINTCDLLHTYSEIAIKISVISVEHF